MRLTVHQPALSGLSSSPDLAWASVPEPPGYAKAFRALRTAAERESLGPDDLGVTVAGRTGLDTLAQARGWSPATCALYGKVARYAGLTDQTWRTPEPDTSPLSLVPLVSVPIDSLDAVRAVAWMAIALRWPAPLEQWAALRADNLSFRRGLLVIHAGSPGSAAREVSEDDDNQSAGPRGPATPPDWLGTGTVDGRPVSAEAALQWGAWLDARRRIPELDASPWALCALRPSRLPGAERGDALSVRGLEAVFVRHALRTAHHVRSSGGDEQLARRYSRLRYDTVRRLVLAADRAATEVPRGAVRASRSRTVTRTA